MARILITDGFAQEGLEILSQAGHELDTRKVTPDELVKIIGEYDGLVVRSATQVVDAVLKAGGARLKVVGRAGVGVDNVDVPTATNAGVIVMNAPLGNIISAAEHTIGMIFAAARLIPQAHAKLTKGEWDKKSFTGVELHGKTLGIIGLGKIGKHVAQVLQAAGMTAIAFDPFLSPEAAQELRIESVSLEALLARADFITVHTPLTEQTRNILSRANLMKTKKGVRIINCARGGVVDGVALVEALSAGRLGGACVDVLDTEPPPANDPLLSANLPNLIITPHVAWASIEAQQRLADELIENIAAFLRGERRNRVV